MSEPRFATGGSGTVHLMSNVESFDVDTGHMVMDNGMVWDSYTTCFNQRINGCTGRLPNIMDTYCPKCQREQDKIERENDKKDKFTRSVQEAITAGALPDDFETWKPRSLVACQRIALDECNRDYNRNVWIHGLRGRGKTEVTYNVVYGAMRNGFTGAFIEAKHIQDAAREHNLWRHLERAKVLIIDDIGKMPITEYSAGNLHTLLSARNKNHVRTIVTAEDRVVNSAVVRLTAAQFTKDLGAATDGRYGGSTVERLSWRGNICVAHEMIGDNLRRVNPGAEGKA